MAPSDFQMAPLLNCRVRDATIESLRAHRCDEYQIRVPEEAWALMPRRDFLKAFLVSLTDCSAAEDGQLYVKVITLGGDEVQFHLAKDSKVKALMLLVAEERQLGPEVLVEVLTADEAVLDAESVLEVVTAS